jgi:hypothetical protein
LIFSGLSHNFAGSAYTQHASVMDYPPPVVEIGENNTIIFNNHSYSNGIGFYDKTSINYAYRHFLESNDPQSEYTMLIQIISDAEVDGYRYMSDEDSTPYGLDWRGTKWDSGSNPIKSLNISMQIRRIALETFNSAGSVPYQRPLSMLRQLFPIVYFWHR